MSDRSAIEWTEATWNPVTGCTKVSPGCGKAEIVLHEDRLTIPIRWRKPRMVFVNSMSDLFHEQVPDSFILQVWLAMAISPEHTFQVLTKRPERMKEFVDGLQNLPGGHKLFAAEMWPLPNVWLGVSVENQRWAEARIPPLLETPAAVRFLSCEPLLGPLELGRWLLPVATISADGRTLPQTTVSALLEAAKAAARQHLGWRGIDWVIAGRESGGPENRRLVEPCAHLLAEFTGGRCGGCHGSGWKPRGQANYWVSNLRNQCVAAGVPFFFKQWGGPRPTSGGRLLDGREWHELPQVDAKDGGRMMADARA